METLPIEYLISFNYVGQKEGRFLKHLHYLSYSNVIADQTSNAFKTICIIDLFTIKSSSNFICVK